MQMTLQKKKQIKKYLYFSVHANHNKHHDETTGIIIQP